MQVDELLAKLDRASSRALSQRRASIRLAIEITAKVRSDNRAVLHELETLGYEGKFPEGPAREAKEIVAKSEAILAGLIRAYTKTL